MAQAKVLPKFAGWASVATCSLIFIGVTKLKPVIEGLPMPGFAVGLLVASLGAYASYRLMSVAMIWAFSRSAWLRAKLLGDSYIEGTWIGCYERDGQTMISVEAIDQRGEHIQIQGRQFDLDGKLHAQWVSRSAAIDERAGVFTYAYDCTLLDLARTHAGVGVFHIERVAGRPPSHLHGYAIDTSDGRMDPNNEVRIGGLGLDDGAVLAEARRRFISDRR